jgi:two-component system, chemotaxis family, protein-glutamate methylesterase/glutaminase
LQAIDHRGTRDAAEYLVPGRTGNRDLVVIGCSAGGVEALPRLLSPLPRDFPATICIVQHLAVSENPYLVEILKRTSPMPVSWADQGEKFERSHVYVGPPDHHLLFSDDHLRLSRGPRENHARPSIDKLFRSAAVAHDGRVIGVLLTGMLDDGVSGLLAIQRAGGITIVQDPDDAAFSELPSRALLAMQPNSVLPLTAIPAALAVLTDQTGPRITVPREIAIEAELDKDVVANPQTLAALGPQTTVACGDCQGPTWLIGDERDRRYRCYLGHVNSARTLLVHETMQVEEALWSAVRALNDRASTLETLAFDSDRLGRKHVADLYTQRAREARTHAELARKFISDVVKAG